jgi:hypothetical protein
MPKEHHKISWGKNYANVFRGALLSFSKKIQQMNALSSCLCFQRVIAYKLAIFSTLKKELSPSSFMKTWEDIFFSVR